jgi:hypothetical protein
MPREVETMRATKPTRYETPRVATLEAHGIVELLGPVSCGSGGFSPLPTEDGIQRQGFSGTADFTR